MKTRHRVLGQLLAHLRRALHVEVEQDVDALARAPARSPRAPSRRGCRAPRPTRAAAPRRAAARTPPGPRSGTRRRPARRRAGARVVCETEKRIPPSSRSTRARTVVLPAPEGAETTITIGPALTQRSAPARGSRSISVLSATTSRIASASWALLPTVLASRISSCARKSRRLPAGRPVCRRAARARHATWLRSRCSSSATSWRSTARTTSW